MACKHKWIKTKSTISEGVTSIYWNCTECDEVTTDKPDGKISPGLYEA